MVVTMWKHVKTIFHHFSNCHSPHVDPDDPCWNRLDAAWCTSSCLATSATRVWPWIATRHPAIRRLGAVQSTEWPCLWESTRFGFTGDHGRRGRCPCEQHEHGAFAGANDANKEKCLRKKDRGSAILDMGVLFLMCYGCVKTWMHKIHKTKPRADILSKVCWHGISSTDL